MLGTIPAIFGQVMASYVVTKLAGLEVQTEPVVNFDTSHYQIFHQRLIEHEESLYGTAAEVQVFKLSTVNLLAITRLFVERLFLWVAHVNSDFIPFSDGY